MFDEIKNMMLNDNNSCYLIYNSILFIPSDNTLCDPNGNIIRKIKPTEARCLLLLIEKQGDVVSQNELMEFAWGDKHRQISFNTFYQCILSLRKAFVQLGVLDSIITTVPRKGVMMESAVSILHLQQDEVGKSVPAKQHANISSEENYKNKSSRLWALVEIAIITSTIIFAVYIIIITNKDYNYFSDYFQADIGTKKCHYYFDSNVDKDSHQLFVNQHPELCQDNKNYYLTILNNAKTISIIICSKPIDNSTGNVCKSIFFPEYLKK